jgi:hypothetical protein
LVQIHLYFYNSNKQVNQIILTENQFFGTSNYINTLFHGSNILFEQYDSFPKASFRNRCVIAGSNGLVNLSVPLVQGRDKQALTKDARIDYSGRWQKEHMRTLVSCYNRSPFFEYYRDDVEKLLEERQEFLLDKNLRILEWLQKILRRELQFSLTETYLKQYDPSYTDLRGRELPKNFQLVNAPVRYTQVFEDRIGFQPNLSILDLLFCAGPDTGRLLQSA